MPNPMPNLESALEISRLADYGFVNAAYHDLLRVQRFVNDTNGAFNPAVRWTAPLNNNSNFFHYESPDLASAPSAQSGTEAMNPADMEYFIQMFAAPGQQSVADSVGARRFSFENGTKIGQNVRRATGPVWASQAQQHHKHVAEELFRVWSESFAATHAYPMFLHCMAAYGFLRRMARRPGRFFHAFQVSTTVASASSGVPDVYSDYRTLFGSVNQWFDTDWSTIPGTGWGWNGSLATGTRKLYSLLVGQRRLILDMTTRPRTPAPFNHCSTEEEPEELTDEQKGFCTSSSGGGG